MTAATSSVTHSGQPSSELTTLASRSRLMPAMSSCATAKDSALTRWAPGPKRRSMNSGTERTFEP